MTLYNKKNERAIFWLALPLENKDKYVVPDLSFLNVQRIFLLVNFIRLFQEEKREVNSTQWFSKFVRKVVLDIS